MFPRWHPWNWISYWGLFWCTSIASITTMGCSAWCHHIGSPSDLWEVWILLGCLPLCKTHFGWALSHSEIPLIPLTAPQQAKLQGEEVSYSHPEAFGHIHCYQAIREKCCAWADKGRRGGEMSHCARPDPITHVLPQEDSRWAWIICVTSEHITWPLPLPRSAQLQIRKNFPGKSTGSRGIPEVELSEWRRNKSLGDVSCYGASLMSPTKADVWMHSFPHKGRYSSGCLSNWAQMR